jgi:hypothetical protein
LEALSDDEVGRENDGITINDVRAFDNLSQEPEIARTITSVGLDLFDSIDRDHNHFLSAREIGLAQKRATESQRTALRAMVERIDQIADSWDDERGAENDGITRADLRAYRPRLILSDQQRFIQDVQNVIGCQDSSASQ